MVRSGKKVALAFVGSFALAQSLSEAGIIEDDPMVVYTYSALIRDLLALCPDEWESAVEEMIMRLINRIRRMLGGRGSNDTLPN